MAAHTDTAAYLDCPACHRTSPARLPGHDQEHARCPSCGAEGPIRVVERRWHDEVDPARQECNAACLGGRISCECRCGGLCHGRGLGGCICRTRPAWSPPAAARGVPTLDLFALTTSTGKEK